MLAVRPERFTKNTVVERQALRSRLARIGKEDVAYDLEEHDEGTCAVAVPVWSRGKVVADVGLIVPVERFSEDAVRAFVEQLRSAALHMEERLDSTGRG
jgi:DNA-binding IclR family transcriptional regulator